MTVTVLCFHIHQFITVLKVQTFFHFFYYYFFIFFFQGCMYDKRLVSEKNYDEKSCVHAFDAGYNQNERLKDEHARYKLREQFLNFYCGQQGLLNHCEAPPPTPNHFIYAEYLDVAVYSTDTEDTTCAVPPWR